MSAVGLHFISMNLTDLGRLLVGYDELGKVLKPIDQTQSSRLPDSD